MPNANFIFIGLFLHQLLYIKISGFFLKKRPIVETQDVHIIIAQWLKPTSDSKKNKIIPKQSFV